MRHPGFAIQGRTKRNLGKKRCKSKLNALAFFERNAILTEKDMHFCLDLRTEEACFELYKRKLVSYGNLGFGFGACAVDVFFLRYTAVCRLCDVNTGACHFHFFEGKVLALSSLRTYAAMEDNHYSGLLYAMRGETGLRRLNRKQFVWLIASFAGICLTHKSSGYTMI